MTKPVLYLDIVGTLLIQKGGGLEVAPFARTFIQRVRDRFQLRFLSSLQEHEALAVARGLGVDVVYVSYPRNLGKATAIDFSEDFYWIDDNPDSADIIRLADERCSGRLIPVNNPREGLTEATLTKLETTLEQNRRDHEQA